MAERLSKLKSRFESQNDRRQIVQEERAEAFHSPGPHGQAARQVEGSFRVRGLAQGSEGKREEGHL